MTVKIKDLKEQTNIIKLQLENKNEQVKEKVKEENKTIKSWDMFENKIHAGKPVWLSEFETRHKFDHIIRGLVIDPFKGSITVNYFGGSYHNPSVYKDIPYINYPITCISKLKAIPPGLRIPREDLWSLELFDLWQKEDEKKRLEREEKIKWLRDVIAKDVINIILFYDC